jgi:hypothetical protein
VNTSIFGIEIAPVCTKTWCEQVERRREICKDSCSRITRREVRCNSAMTRDSSIFKVPKRRKRWIPKVCLAFQNPKTKRREKWIPKV